MQRSLGRIIPIDAGVYDSEKQYEMFDYVRHNRATYLCKKDCKGQEPTENNTEFWKLIVKDGVDGTGSTWETLGGKPFETLNSDDFKVENGVLSVNGTLEGVEQTANKVTSITASSTDTEYPSAKAVYSVVGDVITLLDAL